MKSQCAAAGTGIGFMACEGIPPGGMLMLCSDGSVVIHHPVYRLMLCRCGAGRWYAHALQWPDGNIGRLHMHCAKCGLDMEKGLVFPGPHPMEDVAGGD